MARYLGPKCKLSRREGTDLFLKSGVRPLESKCKLDVPPGGAPQRRPRLSDYGLQLREMKTCCASLKGDWTMSYIVWALRQLVLRHVSS